MAITKTHAELFRSLPIPHGSSLLEIGEANWYGEIEPDFPCRNIRNLHDIAKDFYASWLAPSRIVSVDMNGTASALRLDLNAPLNLGEQFDAVINHGTAEHVFNIAQVFASMHDACKVGGWLIHDAPLHGWIDHGFYCLQPTLFYDLARVNCYEVSLMAVHEFKAGWVQRLDSRDHIQRIELPQNAMLFVALRKRADVPFSIPAQGYYARTISQESKLAWEINR